MRAPWLARCGVDAERAATEPEKSELAQNSTAAEKRSADQFRHCLDSFSALSDRYARRCQQLTLGREGEPSMRASGRLAESRKNEKVVQNGKDEGESPRIVTMPTTKTSVSPWARTTASAKRRRAAVSCYKRWSGATPPGGLISRQRCSEIS